jgi:predicted metalloendopeptidase
LKLHRLHRALAVASSLAACSAAAALDVAGLDRDTDPCADFYRYANQRWLDSIEIPKDRPRWGAFDQLDERNTQILVAALDEAMHSPPPASTPQGKVARFYASGMDTAAIDKAGLRPLADLLARADGIVDAPGVATTLAFLHQHGVDAGFQFAVRPDAKDSTRYLAQITQGGLGLSDRDDYFRDDARSAQTRDAYRKHVTRIFKLAGADAGTAERYAAQVWDMEVFLAKASMTAVERRDVDRTYNKMTVAQLGELAPGFPWRAYFAALGAGDLAEVNVAQPDFAKTVGKLVDHYELWRTYLRWQVLRATASKLPEAFAAENFDFYEGVLRGRKARPPRSREVIEVIAGRVGAEPMGQALSMIFVERAFSAQSKARMQEMVANIKAALAERLRTVEWMSDETRARALDKLASMGVKIGYPDKWRDFSDADVGPYSYVENWMRAKAFFVRRDVSRIGRPVDRIEWFMSPHIVNAQYNASGNEIIFPAGILQPPFFDPKADDAVNYGGIGVVIGHEITHGFDDRGRRFDARGNLTDWWTAQDARRYVERAGRVERQYDGYVGVEAIHVNGKLTLGENISDVGGTKIAYLALQRSLAGKPRESVDGLTAEQRFFLSFAQIWRARSRDENERLQLRTDGHSPPRFRVAGVIANLPEFSSAWSCADGKPLLSESDRANIW